MIISLRRRTAMRKLALKTARYLSLDSEKGVTAIEYGLIASLIAIVIIGALTLVGTRLTTIFTTIANAL
jgi:pilus assembly protein Flp/PilA